MIIWMYTSNPQLYVYFMLCLCSGSFAWSSLVLASVISRPLLDMENTVMRSEVCKEK